MIASLGRWLKSIKEELHVRGLNRALWNRCVSLGNKAQVLQLTAESQAAHIAFLEGQMVELKKRNQAQSQQLFTQDFTIIALRGELALAKDQGVAMSVGVNN